MTVALLRISELARRARVSVPTVKHYVRQGLIVATRKTGRTMAWYDPALVGRIRAIKELQHTRFLPLDVICDAMAGDAAADDDLAAAEAIARVLAKNGRGRARSRDELIAGGANPHELDWLAAAKLSMPSGSDQRYRGDDLALLATLGAARRAGLGPEMLPFRILHDYLTALRALVEVELQMFRAGVLPRAQRGQVGRLTTAATRLSERLVVLLRRKLLLPTLHRLIEEKRDAPKPTAVRRPAHHRRRRVRKRG